MIDGTDSSKDTRCYRAWVLVVNLMARWILSPNEKEVEGRKETDSTGVKKMER